MVFRKVFEALYPCCELTWHLVYEGVEEGYDEVDENGTVEQDVAPHRHVAADPEQSRLTCTIKSTCQPGDNTTDQPLSSPTGMLGFREQVR